MHLKAHNDPGISFNPMASRVSQNCHPSHELNFPLFNLDDIDTMKGKVKFTGFSVDSCALSLNISPLHVLHRSIAAAVQHIDSEILRILGTILIPEDLL